MGGPDYGQGFKEHLEQEIRQRANEAMKRPKIMLLGDSHWGFIWGLLIVLIGLALLLHHMGMIPFDPVARFWPLLLVVFGVMNLLTRSGRFFGVLLILAGAFLQLNKLGITHLSFADLWPVALIVIVLLLMWGSFETRGFLRAKARAVNDFRELVAGAAGGPPTMLYAARAFGRCALRAAAPEFPEGRSTAPFRDLA